MREYLITSDRFIELFITLKQVQFLSENKDKNLYNENWSFDTKLLSEFIFHCKKDYRYQELLSCFNYSGMYCLSLIVALNRALQKHLLTGIYNDIAYLSKFYINIRILEDNSEFASIMEELIDNFDCFCLDKTIYLASTDGYMNENLQSEGDNSRLIFDLQQRIRKKYED